MDTEPRFTEEELEQAKKKIEEHIRGKMDLTEENVLWWLEEE